MLRLVLTPRWVAWTLLAALAASVCGAMGLWQLTRAESPTGSLLNAGYALQWPLFGVFFVLLWWRMLRLEAQALDEVVGEDPGDGAEGDAAPEDPAPEDPAPEDPAPEVGVPAGRDGPFPQRSRRRGRARTPRARPAPEAIGARLAGSGPPFTPRPAGVRAGDGGEGAPGPARAEYNAMLAELAAREAGPDPGGS